MAIFVTLTKDVSGFSADILEDVGPEAQDSVGLSSAVCLRSRQPALLPGAKPALVAAEAGVCRWARGAGCTLQDGSWHEAGGDCAFQVRISRYKPRVFSA